MSTPPTISASSVIPLFSLPPTSPEITHFLSSLPSSSSSPSNLEPEIKSYPDATYHNHHSLGLSLCFLPQKGLDAIDLFNPAASSSSSSSTPSSSRKAERPYSAPPTLSFHFPTDTLTLPPRKEGDQPLSIPRPRSLLLTPKKTGRGFVSCLGEPSRKGAGGWTGVWLEWTSVEILSEGQGERERGGGRIVRVGVMIELSDPGAGELITEEGRKKGMGGVWERAAGWQWKSVKLFKAD